LPFQIIIDIFFFNTMSSFLNVDYLKGLKIWKKSKTFTLQKDSLRVHFSGVVTTGRTMS